MTSPGDNTAAAVAAVDAVVSYFFRQNPCFGRRAGWHRADGVLPSTEPRAAAELDRLGSALGAALRAGPADPELRADLDSALHMVHAEQFQLTALGQAYLTPPEVFAETDVSSYLRDYAPEADRAAALETHLRALPDFLAEAARTLPARLPAGERLRGLESAQGAAAQLATVARRLARPRDLAAAAAAACEEYGRAVHATKPTAQLYGPDKLTEFLRVVDGITWPARELLDRARAEVAAAQHGLDALAKQLGAADRREVVAMLAGQVSTDTDAAFAEIITRVRDFWAGADLVSTDTVTPLAIGLADGPSSAATVEFQVSAPLEKPRPPHLLYLPNLSGTAGAAHREFLNEPMLELLAVHEAYPGHYVHAEAAEAGGSTIRTCFPWIDGLTEGWAHYAEELAVEHGLAEGRPLLRVAQQRSALESSTRLVAFLTMHLKQTGFGAAVAEAAGAAGWSDERAAREILAVTSNPLGAMYALGKIVIRDWRDSAGRMARQDLKHFHDQLLRCGTAPLSTARRYWQDHTNQPASSYSEVS
ncbi:DUF885 family protein [Rhizomonospora bruguierae]|uniref:DUF885 family protein n=1 Tax=Rhizomonospora bruguierae TaxID=1581705 RepID=UPI001BCDE9D5|nr:DUF885 family protein [Micromonospora sp. NBRC 107566]